MTGWSNCNRWRTERIVECVMWLVESMLELLISGVGWSTGGWWSTVGSWWQESCWSYTRTVRRLFIIIQSSVIHWQFEHEALISCPLKQSVQPLTQFLGRLLRVDLIKWVSNVRLPVRTYVRPSTKRFFDFNEIWYVSRGRWVMLDCMQYDPIQGQGHEPLKVRNSAIFKGYLLLHLWWGLTNYHEFFN